MKDRDFPEHSTHPIHCYGRSQLLQYFDYTGDAGIIGELAPSVFEYRLIGLAGYIGRTGIISEAPNYMFMDWVEIEGYEAQPSSRGHWPGLYDGALLPGHSSMVQNASRWRLVNLSRADPVFAGQPRCRGGVQIL